jgi:predicted nucleic acid-binding protein
VDLALYEVGNVLVRSLKWPSQKVAEQLDDLLGICGAPLALTSEWLRDAAYLATRHHLSFYDAAWAAAARGLGIPLISADRMLVGAGLAESPSTIVRRLRLALP